MDDDEDTNLFVKKRKKSTLQISSEDGESGLSEMESADIAVLPRHDRSLKALQISTKRKVRGRFKASNLDVECENKAISDHAKVLQNNRRLSSDNEKQYSCENSTSTPAHGHEKYQIKASDSKQQKKRDKLASSHSDSENQGSAFSSDGMSEDSETEEGLGSTSKLKTPVTEKTNEHETLTRSSARLRKKLAMKGSLELPSRRTILDEIEPCNPERGFSNQRRITKPRTLVNDFFKESSSYNQDKFQTYLSEEDEDGFIVSDQDCIEYESELSEDENIVKSKTKRPKKRWKKQPKFSSGTSDSESSGEMLSKAGKGKRLSLSVSECSTESSNSELNVSSRIGKKCRLILKSESEDEKEAVFDTKSLPRRRNKERERKQRAAAVLKKKRDLVSARIPLDRRRCIEKEIDKEELSDVEDQFDENMDIGTTEVGFVNRIDQYSIRDSDKEFIASSSDEEKNQFKVEEEFKVCLDNLRKSRDHGKAQNKSKHEDVSPSSVNDEPHIEEKLNFRRVYLEYDSCEDADDKDLANLFNLLHKKDCNTNMIKGLVMNSEGMLDCVDSHGRKPLHIASIAGNTAAVEVLLDLGANANALDGSNMASIAYAAYWKHPKVLQLLLNCTDLSLMHCLIHKHLKGMSLLHLILLRIVMPEEEDIQARQMECLKFLQRLNAKMYARLLCKEDKKGRIPTIIAITEGTAECLKELLVKDQSLGNYHTEMEGTVLHLAVEYSDNCKGGDKAICLRVLLGYFKSMVDITDRNGFTALMYAAETGNVDCMNALIENEASVDLQDNQGTSALHLAAAIGSTNCVKLLIDHGHSVDILDDCGWPPLLYANFQSCESCVVELMKAKPKQLFVLSSLIKDGDEKQKEKNMQVVRSTILSLANQDAYYQIFNDFIRDNLELLDEFNHGIFCSTWKAILDFDNKQKWFRRRVAKLRKFGSYCCLTVKRDCVLECAMEFFEGKPDLSLKNLNVMFLNEPGICTGPKKEFLICLCNEVMKPEAKLFTKIDDQRYSPTPLSFFADVLWSRYMSRTAAKMEIFQQKDECSLNLRSPVRQVSGCVDRKRGGDSAKENREILLGVKTELSQKLKAMNFIGRFVAACIADGMHINLNLSSPFIKQILGQVPSHPDDLQSIDNGLYNGMVKWVLANSVEDLEMPFSINCPNPWFEAKVEEVQLRKSENILKDDNKEQFTVCVSKFKLCDSVNNEVKAFKTGFNQELNQDLVSVFTPDEFSLLMNGVQNIDVEDWKDNTKYSGWECNDKEIMWFWKTVNSLKQEEKALLLKFSTGSPCVPAGGFRQLEGLNGKMCFTIARGHECQNSIPTAATCFNLLRLSTFSGEKELRQKVLIAVRHGSEGFAFG